MTYTVKEIFHTLQGEGANMGRPAVFIRFAGCNLWTGREEDRGKAVCQFCDTDFVGGTRFTDAETLAEAAVTLWPKDQPHRMTVITGGEPLLQVDAPLLAALRARQFYIAIETNGTQPLPAPVDWLCVSPKANAPLVLNAADELKLVYPQPKAMPDRFDAFPAKVYWLSPMDGEHRQANTAEAAAYCLSHPRWRLAIQAHKFWGIP